MRDLVINIVAGIALSLAGAAATKGVEIARRRRRYGHLFTLTSHVNRIQIVLPSLNVDDFLPQGAASRATVPPNVRVMPMAEGGAIAQLTTTLNRIRTCEIQLVPQESFQDDADLTISIGGPSLNRVSADILRRCVPAFSIQYPEHVASYGSTSFSPVKDSSGALVEDYGFIASVTAQNGRRSMVLCGVWALGTQIATNILLDLPRQSDARHALSEGINFFAVAHATINGLSQEDAQIVEMRRLP